MDSFNPLGMSGTPEMTEEERQEMLATQSMLDDVFDSKPLPDQENIGESTGSPSLETQTETTEKPKPDPTPEQKPDQKQESKEAEDFYGADLSFQQEKDDIDPFLLRKFLLKSPVHPVRWCN